jgi:hypothetical protein
MDSVTKGLDSGCGVGHEMRTSTTDQQTKAQTMDAEFTFPFHRMSRRLVFPFLAIYFCVRHSLIGCPKSANYGTVRGLP